MSPQRPPLRLLAALIGLAAAASARAGDGLRLRPSSDLLQRLDPQVQVFEPLFIRADTISGQPDIEVQASGDVSLRRHSVVLKADWLHDDLVSAEVHARGNVRILRDGNLYRGPSLDLNLDTETGNMPSVDYSFAQTGGHGHARDVHFLGPQHVRAAHADYTTCTSNPLDWVLQASDLDLDFATNTGVAHDGRVRFKGVTILPLPYASFPLTDARKSGLLPPTIGLDSRNGFEYAQPYYWNIAPNYDATLTPRLLLRRGLMGSAEVRWLRPDSSGTALVDDIPDDRAAGNAQRWAAVLQQQGQLAPQWSYGLNLQRVSDNNWWQDFGQVDPVIAANRTLPQQGQLTWSQSHGYLQLGFNRWQTLQSTISPIIAPYNIQPQLDGRWRSDDTARVQWRLSTEAARFTSPTPGLLAGDRVYVNPSVSVPFIAAQGFFTPRLTLRATRYRTDTPMGNGSEDATRVLPSLSLDSGLVFERSTTLRGNAVTQTLEPRLYYLYTPYRDQQNLPNFDSAPLGLNLASIYTDNLFSGNDRIADASDLTAGATTRLLDAHTGAEYARLTVAQRVLLRRQRVTLTGTPVPSGLNDTFALASVAFDPHWNATAGIDYNLSGAQLVQGQFGAFWHPSSFHTLSVSYQIQSATATQIALKYVNAAWQWRMSGRWYSVGQANYSIQDKQINSSLFGFEYDGGCWVGRFVLQRNALTTATATTRVLFQLELTGLSRLGINPLSALEQNIPGYQLLNQPSSPPSRYANYE